MGKAKYISHLDLMATMQRALLRAGVCLKYSEGFNPHPYLSVALPLSVGCGSVCELMDIGLAEATLVDDLPEIISSVLPEGIAVHSVYAPASKFKDIKWVGIEGLLHYDTVLPQHISEMLAERYAQESIVISKKTKSGMTEMEISQCIRDVRFHLCGDAVRPYKGEVSELPDTIATSASGSGEYGTVFMSARISAQNPSLNPESLMSALAGKYSALAPGGTNFTRTEVFDVDMNVFR